MPSYSSNLNSDLSHILQFTGNVYYVSGNGNGSDSNSGTSPKSPFATIGHAIATCSAGDAIVIRQSTYFGSL